MRLNNVSLPIPLECPVKLVERKNNTVRTYTGLVIFFYFTFNSLKGAAIHLNEEKLKVSTCQERNKNPTAREMLKKKKRSNERTAPS